MSDKSKLDWKEYEAITQYIYGALVLTISSLKENLRWSTR
jgi:hypothetical protein